MEPALAMLKLQAAREMLGIRQTAKTLNLNNAARAKYLGMMLTDKDGQPTAGDLAVDDEMMVLGDVHINQTQTEQQPTPAPATTAPPAMQSQSAPTAKPSLLSRVLPIALALATGGGVAGAIPFVLDLFRPSPSQPPAVSPAPDTDTYVVPDLDNPDEVIPAK